MDFMRQDNGACAVHIERRSNVRFGSKADIAECETNVRFTPKSGHSLRRLERPLCARSGLMHRSNFVVAESKSAQQSCTPRTTGTDQGLTE